MKIVGFATCPVGYHLGHDADECRANKLDTGGIFCVTCDAVYPEFNPQMKAIWAAICASGFYAPTVKHGSDTQPGTDAYNAACLSGYDPSQSDRVQATFIRDGQAVRLDYEQSNQHEVINPDRSLQTSIPAAALETMPPRIVGCIDALTALGFCVRSIDSTMNTVTMTCGRPVGTMGYVIGVSAALSWPIV